MKAAVLEAFGEPLVVCDVDLADPAPGEVRVAIHATGVCHSDLSLQRGLVRGRVPAVLGHEAAGKVVAIGDGVRSVAPGDHVVVMWTPMCGGCFFCQRGQTHLCDAGFATFGVMDDGTSRLSRDGRTLFHGIWAATFAQEAIFRERAVVKIPNDIPFEVAAVVGCGVLTGVGAAVHTARVRPGDAVVVIGCGGVGINVLQGCALVGADPIIGVDVAELKRRWASAFGATHVLDPATDDVRAVVADLTGGRGGDAVFEVVGNGALQRQAFDLTRRGGRCVLVGVAPHADEVAMPSNAWTLGEKTVTGCYYGSCDPRRDIPLFLDLFRAGRLDLEGLVSSVRPLQEVNDALDQIERGAVIRTVLSPNKEGT